MRHELVPLIPGAFAQGIKEYKIPRQKPSGDGGLFVICSPPPYSLHLIHMSREKINRFCIGGAAVTFVITVILHFTVVPFYITGHLVLPWIVAILANNSLNRSK
jgi:hypothetical protein